MVKKMASIDKEAFENRDKGEKEFIEQILELEEAVIPVVKKGEVIEFVVSENEIENDDITGTYEVVVLEKDDGNLELAIRESEEDYEDIVPFSELSLLFDSKLIKVLIFSINRGIIVNAVNRMNRKLGKEAQRISNNYF